MESMDCPQCRFTRMPEKTFVTEKKTRYVISKCPICHYQDIVKYFTSKATPRSVWDSKWGNRNEGDNPFLEEGP